MTSVLLVTSNGTGMGHLTRQAAVALTVAEEHETALFSLSVGLPLAAGLGVRGEYAPSYDRPWISGREWHGYLRDRLLAIIEETRADVLVFDGVAVYPGIAMASNARRDVPFIWLRRGMWQEATNTGQLRRVGHFDLVVEPGDLAGESTGPTARARNVIRAAPVSLIEVIEPLPREEARASLGLPIDGEIALVTLGSGMLGDVAGPGQAAIDTLLTESEAWIAVTRPAVARNMVRLGAGDRMVEIRDVYPQVSYLNAFDIAVSSAGYNAVHELIPAGVPSLFVANSSTRTDDQMARSRRVAGLGLGLHASDLDPESVASGVKRLLDRAFRADLARSAAGTRPQMLGASEVAQTAITLAQGFSERRRKPSAAVSDTVQRAKDSLKDRLGEERTESLKRVLGREPAPRGQRTTVHVVPAPQSPGSEGPMPLAVTTELRRSDLDLGAPIEHLIPGASDAYRQRRMDLVAEYYDVVDPSPE